MRGGMHPLPGRGYSTGLLDLGYSVGLMGCSANPLWLLSCLAIQMGLATNRMG